MSSEEREHKLRTSAVLNLTAGVLFLVAAFNLLSGDRGIDWMYMLVGVVFLIGGVWGLRQ